jgi:hypothetical protein
MRGNRDPRELHAPKRKPEVRGGATATIADAKRCQAHQLLVICHAPMCWHKAAIPIDRFSDDIIIQSIQPRLRCTACGVRGRADVRPDYTRHTAHRP